MTLFIFILILSFLVIIHEFGHFITARKFGIPVEEFGIGYPPKLIRFYTDKHGTDYTLNWLPFGGFVRLYGEEEGAPSKAEKKGTPFYKKSKKIRLAVIVAGAVVNFIFGAVAFGIIYTKTGIPEPFGHIRVDEVAQGSPAQEAGLVPGDIIVGSNNDKLTNINDFLLTVSESTGQTILLSLEGKEPVETYVRTQEETPQDQGALGVTISDTDFVHYPFWQMPFRGMWVGLKSAVTFGIFLLGAIGGIFAQLFRTGALPEGVAGPVGIVHLATQENLLTSGFLSTLNFAAILSINLAIVNILPFPALDGGRALFIFIEKAIGRKLKPKLEYWANMSGMALLLTLIIAISIRDVKTVIADESVRTWWQGIFSRLTGLF